MQDSFVQPGDVPRYNLLSRFIIVISICGVFISYGRCPSPTLEDNRKLVRIYKSIHYFYASLKVRTFRPEKTFISKHQEAILAYANARGVDMINLEFILRVTIFGAILLFFAMVYRRLFQLIFTRITKINFKVASLILALIASIATFFLGSFFYVYYGFGHQPDIYRSGSAQSNMVALTFDDGPSSEFTPAILDILQEYNVIATFFMVGSHIEKYPEIAQRIVDEGHEVGNHTQNHSNIPSLSTVALHKEIMEATAAITDIAGKYPSYIRPPRGLYDGRLRRLANLLGQKIVLWTLSTRDWRYGVTPDKIVKNVSTKVKGGDIILFHDSGALIKNEGGDRRATVLALPQVIETIRARGLEIVPLSIMLDDAPIELYPQVDMPE